MAGAKQEETRLISVDMVQVQGPVALASEEVGTGTLSLTREVPPGLPVVYAAHVAPEREGSA